MSSERDPPRYRRYRVSRLLPGARHTPARSADAELPVERPSLPPAPGQASVAAPTRPAPPPAGPPYGGPPPGGPRVPRYPTPPPRVPRWRRWLRPKRLIALVLGVIVGWIALSCVLFLLSSHFERISPPTNVYKVLDPSGNPLTSVQNILVLGSDQRQKDSKEPGANIYGPSRSDTIMLIRTGGGHAARLSIPRDTAVDIPDHGEQKINAAYAFGGPALSISVIKGFLGIPINHVVMVNFENFPALIDAMGGVNYTGECVIANLDGGSKDGGFTLRLSKGTHHIDGKEALALARTRENLCHPLQTDIKREERQQALFTDMKDRMFSLSSFLRMPLIAWNAPPTIISDMSGPELLGMFTALAIGGTPPVRVLEPSGNTILPGGSEALTVSEAERRKAVAQFLAG